jgi:tRNA threonylcarbamoyladenosine biosynthesis protein TsaB
VSSLELLARAAPLKETGAYLAAIDAGRREWFVSEVRVADDGSRTIGAFDVCDDATLRARSTAMRAPLVGRELDIDAVPHARGALGILDRVLATPPVALDSWEPDYGRLAEAQVKWEAAHGRPLVA